MPQEIKCELCEHESFVRLPGWTPDQIPEGWQEVELRKYPNFTSILIGPFCIAVAVAYQSKYPKELPAQPFTKWSLHPFSNGGFGIADRPCSICGLPDRDPIHRVEKSQSEQARKSGEAKA